MLQAKFYNCSDAPSTLEKTLTPANPTAVSIRNFEPLNDLSGYLYLSNTRFSFNYCLLNGKYYFIGPREYLTNGLCRVYLEEDVLQTFKASIKQLPVVVARNKVCKAAEMFDSELHTLQRTACYVQKLGSFTYDMAGRILVTVG